MAQKRTIGLVFIEGWADWEYGFLAASAVEWFGDAAIPLAPGAASVTSIAGFRLLPQRGIDPGENDDLDAVAIVGSDGWAAADAPDISALLAAVKARGGVVGGICAGTLALARAGLFSGTRHTSNGADWIAAHVPSYAGQELYADVPHAISDGGIVSAPGSAPGTFAAAFLEALHPEKKTELAQMRAMFGAEHRSAS